MEKGEGNEQARAKPREYYADQLQVGMRVTLRALPIEWLFRRSRFTHDTVLVVTKLGPKNAIVRREDGKMFPFPRRDHPLLQEARTNLKPVQKEGDNAENKMV